MGIFRTNNVAEFDDVDGIIVNEVSPPPSVQGVSSNTAILLGQFERGPRGDLSEFVGSIGELHEIYGKSTATGNLELRNKRFGRLKVIRVAAADAVKATLTVDAKLRFDAKFVGVYGNSIKVTVEDASNDAAAVAQVENLTSVADVASSLDAGGVLLQDDAGSVAFWIDVGDSGTTIPGWASAADRAVEVTTIVADDSAIAVSIAMAAAIDGDAKFTVPVPTTAVAVITHTPAGPRTSGGADGAADGFAFVTVTLGALAIEAGSKYTVQDTGATAILPTEVYDNIKIADVVAATFVASQLVDVTLLASGSEVANQAATPLATGSDGALVDNDYLTALVAAEVELAGNVLWSDKYNDIIRDGLKTHGVTAPDKIMVLAGDDPEETDTVAKSKVTAYRDVAGRIVYAWNALKTRINGVNTFTSPAGWIASIISNTSPHIDPAAASNVQYTLGASDIRHKVSRSKYIQLKEAGIAGFERDSDLGGTGIKLKSGIVTQIANAGKVMIHRRRMADFLTSSIARFLKHFQNEPNTAANRALVEGQVTQWDQGLIIDGILPSDAEVTDGKARAIDAETLNTPTTIAAGKFFLLYKRRIFSSMRNIILQAEIGESVVVTEVE